MPQSARIWPWRCRSSPPVSLAMKIPARVLVTFLSGTGCVHAQGGAPWQPTRGHTQVAIWPGAVPDALPNPKPESGDSDGGAFDVSRPTMTTYRAQGHVTGVAAVVFPGGGYQALAMNGEGAEICDWLVSRGITCVLLKYRVPDSGPTMKDGQTYYPPVQTA